MEARCVGGRLTQAHVLRILQAPKPLVALLAICRGSCAAAVTQHTTNTSNTSAALTQDAANASNSSSTSNAPTTTTPQISPLARCASLSTDCAQCHAEGCRFCELGPQPWTEGVDAVEAQGEFLDYSCSIFQCEELRLYRPSTHYTRTVSPGQCSSVHWPTTSTSPAPAPAEDGLGEAGREEDTTEGTMPGFWMEWGVAQWLAVLAPFVIVLAIVGYLWFRRRPPGCCHVKRSRVHVAPLGCGSQNSAMWDFTAAGPLTTSDIEAVDEALAEAEDVETGDGKLAGQPSHRCVVLSLANKLHQAQLRRLGELLDHHPAASLSLPADWRNADDGALLALAGLLRRRGGRCHLKAQSQGDLSPLKLPLSASVSAVVGVAWAVASGGHSEVDALSFEAPSSAGSAKAVVVHLTPLRLSFQELFLSKQPLGDLGCGAACAYVGSWSGRLQIVKMLECDVGDDGAAAIARLISGGADGDGAATALRELNLCENRIGDRGIRLIAEALPMCDSLEKLILDRNRIGPVGSKALALRLPRSNVRELVLGSHLGGNPIGTAGAEAFAGALDDRLSRAAADRATRLQALALEDCGIGEAGAKALAAALPRSDLSVLSVARGDLGDGGANAILGALPANLVSLDLAGNALGNAIVSVVGEALNRVPRLAISLAQNDIAPLLKARLSEHYGPRVRV